MSRFALGPAQTLLLLAPVEKYDNEADHKHAPTDEVKKPELHHKFSYFVM
jgi:hypothetical protein